ncbi:hypothetical protein QR680_005098 [Steinernema hermaphroditum]|uniref:Nematode cuticle collagen N-terminal domain-containing protein n=1 Tax=Steinernema hermaphroditum TaxID=289476 RepID=A0AA39HQU8_9BILA|nr:hypothetical protein QR680_005098 [Steinernema hermaphroditum]
MSASVTWVVVAAGALVGVLFVCLLLDSITEVWNEIDREMDEFNKDYTAISGHLKSLSHDRKEEVARRRRYYQPVSGIVGTDLYVVQTLTVDIGVPMLFPEGSCACRSPDLHRYRIRERFVLSTVIETSRPEASSVWAILARTGSGGTELAGY